MLDIQMYKRNILKKKNKKTHKTTHTQNHRPQNSFLGYLPNKKTQNGTAGKVNRRKLKQGSTEEANIYTIFVLFESFIGSPTGS